MNTQQPNPNDPLAAAWTQQKGSLAMPGNNVGLGRSIAEAHRDDQRRLIWLNIREVAPALAAAVVFGVVAPTAERPAAMFAAAVLFLFVGLYLVTHSIRHHRGDRAWGSSVRDQMQRRLNQLHHRARLYQTTPVWYFLPAIAGMGLALYGFGIEHAGSSGIVFAAIFAVTVGGSIYKAHREGQIYRDEIERLAPILADFDRVE